MSLINRIAITNFMNINGAGTHLSWMPRFRHTVLDFHGQSTAINARNGCGKTSLSQAVLALLSRDKKLITETHKKMAPRSYHIPSHIQIEFISPDDRNASQGDFIVDQGGRVNGETWVFGVMGFRQGDKNDDLTYYFYPGTLEDCPVALSGDENTLTLLTPESFDDARKGLRKFWWRPRADEWDMHLSQHVSIKAMKKLAEFQRHGSADKGASLFNLKGKKRPGERFDEAFFYEVIAPELLAGAMDKYGEEDEEEMEAVIYNAVSQAVRTRQKAEEKRADMDQFSQSLEQVEQVAMYAEQSKVNVANYQQKLDDIAGASLFLETLAVSDPVIGIPSPKVPDGMTGEVAKHIVMEPGEAEPCILASGLSVVLDREAKHVTERARNKRIEGRKIPQVVEIIADLLYPGGSNGYSDVGQKPVSYTLKQAHQIVDITEKCAEGMTKADVHRYLDDAFAWYFEHGDRNPFRNKLQELMDSQDSISKDIKSIEEEIEGLQDQERELFQSQQQMSANEAAYDKLRSSGQLSSEELQEPKKTSQQIKEGFIKAQREMSEFRSIRDRLSVVRDDWRLFKDEFGEDANPHEVERTKQEEKAEHDKRLEKAEQRLGELRAQLQSVQNRIHEIDLRLSKANSKIERFESLSPAMRYFSNLFGDKDPETLEVDLKDERRDCEGKASDLTKEITRLEISVEHLKEFQQQFGKDADPSEQLRALNEERSRLTIEKERWATELTSLRRRRKELDREPIAAGDAANQARSLLEESNIEFVPLFKAVESFQLEADRKKQILSHFSALLFSPVIEGSVSGERAAELLAQENIPVPVILQQQFKTFCESSSKDAVDSSIFVGIVTRAVACLMDPELVEREKQELDNQITSLADEIDSTVTRLAEIDTESPLIALVRAAEKAVQENAHISLETALSSLKGMKQRLSDLEPMLTSEAIGWIRGAREFNALGGLETFGQLKSELDDLQATHKTESEKLGILHSDSSKAEELRREMNAIGKSIFPSSMHAILRSAKRFYDDGGPVFEKTETQESIRLEKELTNASARNDLRGWCDAAQSFLDASRSGDGSALQDKLAEISSQVSDAKKELHNLKAEMASNDQLIPSVKELIGKVDNLAIAIIDRYRKVARFGKDIDRSAEKVSDNLKDALQLADALTSSDMQDKEKVKQQIVHISDEVLVLDVSAAITEAKRRQEEVKSAEKRMKEHIEILIQMPGLAVAEKERLSTVNGAKDAEVVINFWRRLRDIHDQKAADLDLAESDEKESRDTVSGRLNYFIQRGASNLTLFKHLARKNYGDMKANFIVEAQVISEEESENLVLEIIDIFEEEESARRRSKKKGINVSSDDAHRKNLESSVRAMVYRRLFKEPSIHYEMEAIRKTGKHIMDDDSVSGGEGSAMSLMWAIRIADFAVEKEAKGMLRPAGRAKARGMAESILIIDGLFSDLSATDLIKSAMSGIERTRGKFQLIGLIHLEHYDNDFSIFPNLLLGKVNQSLGDSGGWVSFDNMDKSDKSVGFARLRTVKPIEPVS